jgi:hypothetical protein
MEAIMDGSLHKLPDPVVESFRQERRRFVRQKLHTPVYATFNGPETDMVVDLSELLDLNEEGFAVQTSEPLEMNRAVTLCLDLTETKSYVHGSGQVIWSDETGRGGIRFSNLSEISRQRLQEWLFGNLLVACANHTARTEQLAERDHEPAPPPVPLDSSRNVIPISDHGDPQSSLESVRDELSDLGDDLDAILQLIARCSLALAGASGAALAFLTGGKMICRARAGTPAPPLGAPVDVTQGLTGECIRSGVRVSCEDTENDSRIDREVGRALGIGSLMAVPIVSGFRVIGLLEVFSPLPGKFSERDAALLEWLVELIPKDNREPDVAQPESLSETALRSETPEPPASLFDPTDAVVPASEQGPDLFVDSVPPSSSGRLQWALLGLTILAVVLALGYLIGPLISRHSNNSSSLPSAVQAAQKSGEASNVRGAQPRTLGELRSVADQGDAEAQYLMGIRYHSGEGVPHDDAKAVEWFERAAEQGQVDAQSLLGAYYWAGRGVPANLSKAYYWSVIALAGGDDNSRSRLEGLAAQMTAPQVSAARQQAEAWIRQHTISRKTAVN